jgi:hypothetical protein
MFPSVMEMQSAAGYGSAGGMGGFGGGGFFAVPDKRPRTIDIAPGVLHQIGDAGPVDMRASMDDLIHAITSTISPLEWQDAGGSASVAQLGAALLVSASERTHQQIETLLNLFRERWGSLRTISVQAWWLWLTDAQLAEILQAPQGNQPGPESVQAFGLVKQGAWDELLKDLAQAPRDEGPVPVGYRAVVTCYNGQTVSTVAGDQSIAVTRMEPVLGKGENTGVGYAPTVNVVHQGAALQVTPSATSSGKFVIVDVHSRVNLVDPPEEQAAATDGDDPKLSTPGEVVAAMDRPRLRSQRLSTTLRVPVGDPMLIGGMSFKSFPVSGDPNLFLFLKVSVQELRDEPAVISPEETRAEPKTETDAKPEKKP